MVRLCRVDEPRSASDSARFGDPIDSCLGKPLASTPRGVNRGRVACWLQVPFGRRHSAIDIYRHEPKDSGAGLNDGGRDPSKGVPMEHRRPA
jgi:hypothetical protein